MLEAWRDILPGAVSSFSFCLPEACTDIGLLVDGTDLFSGSCVKCRNRKPHWAVLHNISVDMSCGEKAP